MDDLELTNFTLDNSGVNLKEVIDVYWINKSDIRDFGLSCVPSTFTGFDIEFKENVDRSWERLQARARKLFPKGDVFSLYNQNDICWEGFTGGDPALLEIGVSKGIDYKMITSIRSDENVYNQLDKDKSPKALVLANVLITADNMLVMGKRKFYGDWPFDTYECPGAFLHEEDIAVNSVLQSAKRKVLDDYCLSEVDIKTVPFAIYYLPRILEVVIVCISIVDIASSDLKSDFYEDVLKVPNTKEGIQSLIDMPIGLFHPPSRVIMQFYYENFELAHNLLASII